jgi:poly-beta-1,6-N-acetyl-D-glucosamine synthase
MEYVLDLVQFWSTDFSGFFYLVVEFLAWLWSFWRLAFSGVGILVVIFVVSGLNFTLWGLVGLFRFTQDSLKHKHKIRARRSRIKTHEVAVVMPAHNEAAVIADSLSSLSQVADPSNIFIVSDGSTDNTAEIARSFKVHVLNLADPHGKAGALAAILRHFNILNNYKAVLFLDADSRLRADYLENAVPLFINPRVAAVAGYATTVWQPKKLSFWQKFFVLHRERIYFLNQVFLKFGQTWERMNVTPIVPGFASIYRCEVLKKIDINPPGLIIEDFNMTFEIHKKGLGLIVHHPTVLGYTQDPGNFYDYFRQIRRWQLGLWQTILRHGFWPGKFWPALVLQLLEVFFTSIIFTLLPLGLLFYLVLTFAGISISELNAFRMQLPSMPLAVWLLMVLWLPDYVLTLLVALVQKRFAYVIVGIGFVFLRFFDGLAFLSAIPKAVLSKNSTGRWVSPRRRTV